MCQRIGSLELFRLPQANRVLRWESHHRQQKWEIAAGPTDHVRVYPEIVPAIHVRQMTR